MTTPTPTGTPDATDNWASTTLDAPRQKAGEAIEQASDRADTSGTDGHRIDADQAADAEVAAERQATGRGPSAAA